MIEITPRPTLGNYGSLRLQVKALTKTVLAFHGQQIYTNVEVGIARKKRLFRVAFPLVCVVSRSRLGNMAMLLAVFLGYRGFRHPDPESTIFEYGLSHNNIVSFDRLNACLPETMRAKVSVNGRASSFRDGISAAMALGSIWTAAGVLRRHRHARALPQLQAVIAVATLLFYRRHPLPAAVTVLCTASDHSPVCQGLLFLASYSGLKTCYVQHAPVTEYFPPLAYDLAILHDLASARVYERAAMHARAAVLTKTVFLPPFSCEFEPPNLGQAPYNVGICLSFLPDIARLAALVDEMVAHPAVKTIVLRKHPRCAMGLSRLTGHSCVSLQPKGETAETFFDKVDFVLVPNSGVTIEALHHGRPTFFTPGADDIPDDYYGFVANGIVPKFCAELLDDRDAMLAFFDNAWQARFGTYDETVHTSLEVARKTVSEAFMRLM